jgi:hypothetical protein
MNVIHEAREGCRDHQQVVQESDRTEEEFRHQVERRQHVGDPGQRDALVPDRHPFVTQQAQQQDGQVGKQ